MQLKKIFLVILISFVLISGCIRETKLDNKIKEKTSQDKNKLKTLETKEKDITKKEEKNKKNSEDLKKVQDFEKHIDELLERKDIVSQSEITPLSYELQGYYYSKIISKNEYNRIYKKITALSQEQSNKSKEKAEREKEQAVKELVEIEKKLTELEESGNVTEEKLLEIQNKLPRFYQTEVNIKDIQRIENKLREIWPTPGEISINEETKKSKDILEEILLEENFDLNNAEKYKNIENMKVIKDNERIILKIEQAGPEAQYYAHTSLNENKWKNYLLEFDTKLVKGQNISVTFLTMSSNEDKKKYTLDIFTNGLNISKNKPLFSEPLSFEVNKWHKIKIEVNSSKENNIIVTIDDKKFELFDSERIEAGGFIISPGSFEKDTIVYIDNVKVTALTETTKLAQPRISISTFLNTLQNFLEIILKPAKSN